MSYQNELSARMVEEEQLVTVTQDYEMKLRVLQSELKEARQKNDVSKLEVVPVSTSTDDDDERAQLEDAVAALRQKLVGEPVMLLFVLLTTCVPYRAMCHEATRPWLVHVVMLACEFLRCKHSLMINASIKMSWTSSRENMDVYCHLQMHMRARLSCYSQSCPIR